MSMKNHHCPTLFTHTAFMSSQTRKIECLHKTSLTETLQHVYHVRLYECDDEIAHITKPLSTVIHKIFVPKVLHWRLRNNTVQLLHQRPVGRILKIL